MRRRDGGPTRCRNADTGLRSSGRAVWAPREILRQLQAEAQLTPKEAQNYLEELREEKLAAEKRRPA